MVSQSNIGKKIHKIFVHISHATIFATFTFGHVTFVSLVGLAIPFFSLGDSLTPEIKRIWLENSKFAMQNITEFNLAAHY